MTHEPDDDLPGEEPPGQLYQIHAVPAPDTASVGYWCVVCMRLLERDESGVVVHDNVPHPTTMTFDEDARPQ